MKLKNKVAIVTGSSRGIGRGIAEGFIKEGAKVAICATSIESAKKGVEDLKNIYEDADLFAVELNIAESNSVKKAFSSVVDYFGSLDILVNNAGIVKGGPLNNLSEEDFMTVQNVNVNGVFRCTKEAVSYMKNGGSIINVSSINGLYGSPGNSAYATSKAAVIGLTKSLGRELAPMNIRVNCICPGVIETDMVDVLPEEIKSGLLAMTPIGRLGKVADFEGICNVLASDEGSFITGSIFSIDGGALF